jgi:superfamily II DNA or RNA helicase
MQPRWYQEQIITEVRKAWVAGHKNVLAVSPPRSGKTKTAVWLSEPFINDRMGVCFQVHREELIRQISLEYAEFGIVHNILAPNDVIQSIIHLHITTFKRKFYDPNSPMTIGSVDTINARAAKLTQWASQIRLWITDEAHHQLSDNKWGRVVSMFPNSIGLGLTATPIRADGKSLARAQGGVFDWLVSGPTARQLIDEEHICDYRIIAPPSSIDREAIRVGSKGEFTQKGLTEAQKKSTITGDCVSTYQKYTPGEQAICFCVDIEHANEMRDRFRDAGLSSESVSSKTPKSVRKAIMDKFQRGVFQVLVNVDLLGEGLNVHGISVVIMARPTKSFGLYVQQFFRALTASKGKGLATIIDHAGNVGHFGKFYGLPDSYSNWTLYAPERGKRREKDDDVIPITTCDACFEVYEVINKKCPFCGHEPVPESRSKPDEVDGDLIELDVETLKLMRGEINRIDGAPRIPEHLSGPAALAIKNRWVRRQEVQAELRRVIALWAGVHKENGEDDSKIYRRFFHSFGTDILTAQAYGVDEAEKLTQRIKDTWV